MLLLLHILMFVVEIHQQNVAAYGVIFDVYSNSSF